MLFKVILDCGYVIFVDMEGDFIILVNDINVCVNLLVYLFDGIFSVIVDFFDCCILNCFIF